MSSAADTVLAGYTAILSERTPNAIENLRNTPIPHFEEACLKALCADATTLFQSQSSLLELHGTNVNIVGDLHGSIFDLLRILKDLQYATTQSVFLFLGDYVDRGDFSVEVITLLYALAVREPKRFFLLRGNHEFVSISANYGFRAQVVELYGNDIVWQTFVESFAFLPLAAVIDDVTLCVHGGISPSLKHVEQLRLIPRPIREIGESQLVKDILWADPAEKSCGYVESSRMKGAYNFGCTVVRGFLSNNNLKELVRAHQYIEDSVKYSCGCVYTVFSASSYDSHGSNPSAVLLYDTSEQKIEVWVKPAMPRPQHGEIQFFTMRFTPPGAIKEARRMSISLQMPMKWATRAGPPVSLRKNVLIGQRSTHNLTRRVSALASPTMPPLRRPSITPSGDRPISAFPALFPKDDVAECDGS